MTGWSALEDRRVFLEETFFAKENEMLLERLRVRLGLTPEPLEPEEPWSGDPALLSELASLGLTPRTVKALSLAPLVVVAWADGWLAEAERRTLLAREFSIAPVPVEDQEVINHWLDTPPDARLFDAWKHYMQSLAPTLSVEAWARLRNETLLVARSVAKAGGGFLGRGQVTPSEAAIIAEIEAVFTHHEAEPVEVESQLL